MLNQSFLFLLFCNREYNLVVWHKQSEIYCFVLELDFVNRWINLVFVVQNLKL